jgi:hypothetical protein
MQIELLLFTTLFIFGWHAVTRPDKLLSFLGVYVKEDKLPAGATDDFTDEQFAALQKKADAKRNRWAYKLIKPFAKPISECLICMSSFWGVAALVCYHFQFYKVVLCGVPIWYAAFPICVAGLNFIIEKIIAK